MTNTDSVAVLDGPTRALAPLLGGDLPEVPVTGPRRWWQGPLDVEGLALGSVRAAAAAAVAFGGETARGLSVDAAPVCGAFSSLSHLRVAGRRPAAFAPLSGFFPTADGWIRVHGNYPHHAAALRQVLRAADPDGVRAALAGRPGLASEESIRRAGGVAAVVRTGPSGSPAGHDPPRARLPP